MIIGLKWPSENLGIKCAILGRKRQSLSFWQRYTSTILHYKVLHYNALLAESGQVRL